MPPSARAKGSPSNGAYSKDPIIQTGQLPDRPGTDQGKNRLATACRLAPSLGRLSITRPRLAHRSLDAARSDDSISAEGRTSPSIAEPDRPSSRPRRRRHPASRGTTSHQQIVQLPRRASSITQRRPAPDRGRTARPGRKEVHASHDQHVVAASGDLGHASHDRHQPSALAATGRGSGSG